MTKIVNQQISNIIVDLKNNNRALEIDINNLNNSIHEKEKIVYVLKNYNELIKKYKIIGIVLSVVGSIILGISAYMFGNFVNASILDICILELGTLTLSILSGIQYALDNDYTKIKKEYNLKEVSEELEILKEDIVAKSNAFNNNVEMINIFLQETQDDTLDDNNKFIKNEEELLINKIDYDKKIINKRVLDNNKILAEIYKKLEKLEKQESDLNQEEMKHQNKIEESKLNKLQIKKNDVITQIDDLADEIEILKDQISADEEQLNINNRYSGVMNIEEEIDNILDDRDNNVGKKLERRRDK